MAFGKLYTRENNPGSIAIRAVAKANKLELEEVEIDSKNPPIDYLKLNKLGTVPSFQGADGYELTEALAIAIYITSQNEKTSLLGKTKQDYASIVRWMSFVYFEINPKIGASLGPLTGAEPYNKKLVDENLKGLDKACSVLNDHLLVHTFLVGERITLADLFCAGLLIRGFDNFFDKKWREEYPNVTRWYETIHHQPIYSSVVPPINLISEAIKYTPPKKEEKPKQAPKQEKAAPKPKAKEVDDEEEEEDKPAPKPKHPLEALPKSTIPIDEWKRKYSNEETREVALPWFWQSFYNPEEYSLWKVDYKYNDELTMTFMTSNLIGGFFARLEGSRKYIFGAASVFGVTNDSVIQGAFVIRGQDAIAAFDVAPDWESYSFTKLDPQKDKEFVDDMWAWDKPISVNGKTYEWADGKVFK